MIRTFRAGRTDLAELMVGYNGGGKNFSIIRCHDFSMHRPIRNLTGLPEFSVRGLYRAVETLGEKREAIITAFRD